MSEYAAVVSDLKNVRAAEGLDRLNLATVAGHTVLIGKNHKEGEIGLFSPLAGNLRKSSRQNTTLSNDAMKTDNQQAGCLTLIAAFGLFGCEGLNLKVSGSR